MNVDKRHCNESKHFINFNETRFKYECFNHSKTTLV
jgi:hypothetical protein